MKKEINKLVKSIQFTKDQILNSVQYRGNDAASVILKSGELYTLEEVNKLIDEFMKKEVALCH